MGPWSPALRRRYRIETAFGPARLGAVLLRPRGWLLAICLGLLVVASGAAAQAPSESRASCATTLTEEPIAPIPPPPVADPNKLALGERLFTDPRLSAGGDLACSSCHVIHSNGAGGRKASVKANAGQGEARDKPKPRFDTLTVFNAALNFRLNWEGDIRTFAAQIESSLENPENMRTSVSEVVRKLHADHEIAEQFRVAYGQDPDRENFLDALVTLDRKSTRLNSSHLGISYAVFC